MPGRKGRVTTAAAALAMAVTAIAAGSGAAQTKSLRPGGDVVIKGAVQPG